MTNAPVHRGELEARAEELRRRIDALRAGVPRVFSPEELRQAETAIAPLARELREVQRQMRYKPTVE
jgi:hypothetical protein